MKIGHSTGKTYFHPHPWISFTVNIFFAVNLLKTCGQLWLTIPKKHFLNPGPFSPEITKLVFRYLNGGFYQDIGQFLPLF